MNVITDKKQLKVLITLSQMHTDISTDEVFEMWLARIVEMSGEEDEDKTVQLST
jgi:hypothetical protein